MWAKQDCEGNITIKTDRDDECWIYWADKDHWVHYRHGTDKKGRKKDPPLHMTILAVVLEACQVQEAERLERKQTT